MKLEEHFLRKYFSNTIWKSLYKLKNILVLALKKNSKTHNRRNILDSL